MDNSNLNYRGSQRALKMLQAQIQQKSGVPTVKKPTERLPWPPKTTSLSSLDPAFESSHEVPARSSSSGQFVTSNRPQMQAGACTPIHSRISNTYNSPEASIPSNGGIKFHCENNLDLESSRLSNLPHSELLVVDFNSTHGFTNDLRADESQQNAPSRPEQASADDYEMANEDDETRSSMCFSFSDGKVTALVVTADGAYCIAGFSTGAIRLFDLTKGGNTDPEDRFGYQIGFIESNRGSVQIHLELGSSTGRTDGSSAECCHLFACARQGSTTMLVVDIGSLREVHKKRGFITVAGGGVQVLSHSDARLKGLTSLSTISCIRPTSTRPPGNSQEAPAATNIGTSSGGHVRFLERPESAEGRGYTATYRLITGRGFGNYHLWEVTLEARPVTGLLLGSPSGASSNTSSSGGGSNNGLGYTQQWTHLFQGSVNGPTMNFAHFVDISAAPAPSNSSSSGGGATLSLWSQCQERALLLEPDLSARGGRREPPVRGTELLVSDTQKELRLVSLVPATSEGDNVQGLLPSGGKLQVLKDTIGTYASSQDGTVLFGGKYELIVTVLAASTPLRTAATAGAENNASTQKPSVTAWTAPVPPANGISIAFRAVFSLNDFVSGAVGRSSKKASRHLREISSVWCTPDGCYALILCTDNAVLLYSVCDITGKSSFPTRTEGWSGFYNKDVAPSFSGAPQTVSNCGAGFLTYLFEADDSCNLDLGIAYITTEADRAQAADKRSSNRRNRIYNNASKSTHCHGPACPCGIYSTRRGTNHHHLPPENVLISISWWLVENPMLGGVLKVCKLMPPAPPSSSSAASSSSTSLSSTVRSELLQQIVPSVIATSSLLPEGGTQDSSAPTCDKCLLCGDERTRHWNSEDLAEAETLLFSEQSANRAASTTQAQQPNQPGSSSSSSRVPPEKEKEKEKRPPKKKDAATTEQIATIDAVKSVPSARDKRQKLTHSHSQSKERLLGENSSSSVAFASPSDYFEQDTNFTTSTVDATEPQADTAKESKKRASSEVIDLCKDDVGTSLSRSATPATELLSQLPESSQSAEADFYPRSRRTSRVDYSSAFASTTEQAVAASASGSPSSLTAKELRLELERLRTENRRLRIDTDLTMRKADRRFELEMVARRYWKREKAGLEGVIVQMQKEQQRWGAEKDKVKRLHVLLQDVLHTASTTLQYSDEDRGGDATVRNSSTSSTSVGAASSSSSSSVAAVSGNKSTTSKPAVFSPASRLLNSLTEVNKAYENGEGSVMNNSSGGAQSGGGYGSSSASGGYTSASNSGRKPFFCIVCLDHTARVAIQPCGHICFCTVHAEEMQRRIHDHHHSKCPLCQVKIERFLTIQGIDMPDSL